MGKIDKIIKNYKVKSAQLYVLKSFTWMQSSD